MFKFIKATVIVAFICGLTACASNKVKSRDLYASSVEITNLLGNIGGSGIVLFSKPNLSLVLTNSHVCGVVTHGGVVSNRMGKFIVAQYKRSRQTDLCLIKVYANLGARTVISSHAPILYHTRVLVSGHPSLLPDVITSGVLSGKRLINVMIGVRPCTQQDENDPNNGPYCAIFGEVPVLKEYNSALVSATIMPGSSGSGVYNMKHELIGVVFAGSSQFGYGWTISYQDMMHFLFVEQQTLPYVTPTNNPDPSVQDQEDSEKEFMTKLNNFCNSTSQKYKNHICDTINVDY